MDVVVSVQGNGGKKTNIYKGFGRGVVTGFSGVGGVSEFMFHAVQRSCQEVGESGR